MAHENNALVERFIQGLFTEGRPEAADECLSPGFVNHDPFPGLSAGPEGMRQIAAIFRAGFPDWNSVVKDLIAEGDKVVERFTAGGTHEGDFMGLAATGRAVQMDGINIWRIEAGHIAERWGVLDQAGLIGQLHA